MINSSLGGNNFFINGIILCFIETFGYFVMMFTSDIFSRKSINIFVNVGFLISILCLLIIQYLMHFSSNMKILFFLKLGIDFIYLYII